MKNPSDNLTHVPDSLYGQWVSSWPSALAKWSKFTRLRSPILCLTDKEAKKEGLESSFAMIRLQDQAVVINLLEVMKLGLTDYACEILSHEIGHHILAPATLTDHGRLIARMRWALPTVEQHAPMAANLYTDILINNRLQRGAGLRLADIYRKIRAGQDAGAVWTVYMRIYEILWELSKGSLGGGATDDRMEGDALLGARLLRSYAIEWLDGAGRFAALMLPYFLEDQKTQDLFESWFDTRNAAKGGEPAGLTEEDRGERDGAIHPAEDPDLGGWREVEEGGGNDDLPVDRGAEQPSRGQAREPYQYGEILRAAGIKLSDHDMAVRYYRERARPYVVPFPSRSMPRSLDPLPEGLEPWEIGQSLDDIDWMQSILQSPLIVPGMSTVQRIWGNSEGVLPRREPIDLDLYVDSSGSMTNPQQLVSYPALAGAVICLSALRAGARVQATLWSGKNQHTCTPGFVRHETEILKILTGHIGGATAFPIHLLRETYFQRKVCDRIVHIMVISDEGVTTMFDSDEKGNSGWDIAAMALKRAGGGGSFVLNLPSGWEKKKSSQYADYKAIARARDELGWNIYSVTEWDELLEFARRFSRLTYFADRKQSDQKVTEGVWP
ncbi:MAG: VWA domain-containing protein [Deltaproteobacteria bacterium]